MFFWWYLPCVLADNATRKFASIHSQLSWGQALARQGAILREGIDVVLVGEPNVCKLPLMDAVSEISGEFTPDDLLGVIFSRFCIGK